MSFWRKIAGLAARNLDEAECDVCPPGLPGEDPAFSTAVTALGAKLAKADGDAQADEFAAFSEVFQPDAGQRSATCAGSTSSPARPRAASRAMRGGWPSATAHCPQLLEDVLDGLFYVATSDGVVTGDELDLPGAGLASCSARAR